MSYTDAVRRFTTDHPLTGGRPTGVYVRFYTDADKSADMPQGLAPAPVRPADGPAPGALSRTTPAEIRDPLRTAVPSPSTASPASRS
ncbi:hypothetical protein MRI28_16345 [Nocardiopsis dassonvillei]|uniref:hypothetical protein n=1 Tax=Nocardiopsis dassonvillei TaxID=2014 RepID=UPI00200F0674|nr:hypothetical protein [Nocardiopsis dassonvillei]MCK9871189.1 hypothetical protein [Nocardiopsis dassonvillei]